MFLPSLNRSRTRAGEPSWSLWWSLPDYAFHEGRELGSFFLSRPVPTRPHPLRSCRGWSLNKCSEVLQLRFNRQSFHGVYLFWTPGKPWSVKAHAISRIQFDGYDIQFGRYLMTCFSVHRRYILEAIFYSGKSLKSSLHPTEDRESSPKKRWARPQQIQSIRTHRR